MNPVKWLFLAVIRFYQTVISANTPAVCRFHPTCSAYAAQAIETHGAMKGSWVGAWRILRCHPFHPGGYDPVPKQIGAQNRWGTRAADPEPERHSGSDSESAKANEPARAQEG